MKTNATNNLKSTYKVDVIQNNKAYKNACRSVNKGLKMLKYALDGEVGAKPMIAQIDRVLKDPKLYEEVHKNVRRINKGANKGKTCPFYILQAIYKLKEGKTLTNDKPQNTVKVTVKKTAKPKNEVKPVNNAKSLQKQTVKELTKIANDLSINVPTNTKKADLISLIKKAA